MNWFNPKEIYECTDINIREWDIESLEGDIIIKSTKESIKKQVD